MKSFTSILSSFLIVATMTTLVRSLPQNNQPDSDTVCVPIAFDNADHRLFALAALDAFVCQKLTAGSPERNNCELFSMDKMDPATFRACGTVSGNTAESNAAGGEICIPVTFQTANDYTSTLATMKTFVCDPMVAGLDKDSCNRCATGELKQSSTVACGVPRAPAA